MVVARAKIRKTGMIDGNVLARDISALLAAAPKPEQQEAPEQKAPLAAIEFALRQGMECYDFLRLWNEGEFDIIRQEWPECPDAVFVGADPLFAADRARRKS